MALKSQESSVEISSSSPLPPQPSEGTTYGSPPPSSGDSSSSSRLDDEEDITMSDNESIPSIASPLPEHTKQHSPPPISVVTTPPTPAPGPMFLNFKRDLSLKVSKSNKDKNKPKASTIYKVNGVNILNKSSVDGKTVIERQKLRRVRHNHIERLRRDAINNIINELSQIIPDASNTGDKPNKGNVLKLTLEYVKNLQSENQSLRQRIELPSPREPSPHHPMHLSRPLHLEIPTPLTLGNRNSLSPVSPRSPSGMPMGESPWTGTSPAHSPAMQSSPLFPPAQSPRGSLSPMMPPLDRYSPQPPPTLPSINLYPTPDYDGQYRQMHPGHPRDREWR